MRIAATLVLLAGCSTTCRDGTIFLRLQYDQISAQADTVDLLVTVGGKDSPAEVRRPPGRALDTIEVDFAGGYPRGGTVTVSAQAWLSDTPLGAGSGAVLLADGCESLTVEIAGAGGGDAGVVDEAVPIDQAGSLDQASPPMDLSAADLSPLPDLSQICDSDLGPPPACPGECACPRGSLCCKTFGRCQKVIGPACN
jgi:hypothetical protein